MLLDTALLNTQHYKVGIKGKVKETKRMELGPPLNLGVVAIEKGLFGSPSTTVTNFIYIYIYIYKQDLVLSKPQGSTCHRKIIRLRTKIFIYKMFAYKLNIYIYIYMYINKTWH